MSEPEISDVELMCRAGTADDASSFAVLVRRYQNVLLNLFLRKGVSYVDGQDLAQRTFLRLWRYRRRYRPQAKFTTFLFLLANQEALDFFRAAKSRREMEKGLERELETCNPLRVAADKAASGARALAGENVRQAVAALTPALRDVVELGVFQELPYAEVSAILGIPQGTVKSRMFNALRRLKEMLVK